MAVDLRGRNAALDKQAI